MTRGTALPIIYIELASCHEKGEYLTGASRAYFVHRSPGPLFRNMGGRSAPGEIVCFSPTTGLELEAVMSTTLWLTQWDWNPSLLLGTAAVIAAYLSAIGPLRIKYRLGPAVPLRRAVAFFLGVDVIFFALFSPLDAIGDSYLFAAHMAQHLLLSLAGPPLLLLGLPPWLTQPLLRHPITSTLG